MKNICYYCFLLVAFLNSTEGLDQKFMVIHSNDYLKPPGSELDFSLTNASHSHFETEPYLKSDSTPLPENCTLALEKFSDTVVNFTRCAVLNARPIRICQKCENELNATTRAYEILKTESDICQKIFFGSDQLGIIDIIYQEGEALWNKSNCQNCFKYKGETVKFFNASDELDACIQNSNKSLDDANGTCELCRDLYVKLNNIYNEFVHQQEEFDKGICMDIVDKMNITRRIWSTYNCISYDTYIGYPNVITAVLVGTMPLFFYLLARHVSIIEDVKIVRPKRKAFSSIPAE